MYRNIPSVNKSDIKNRQELLHSAYELTQACVVKLDDDDEMMMIDDKTNPEMKIQTKNCDWRNDPSWLHRDDAINIRFRSERL